MEKYALSVAQEQAQEILIKAFPDIDINKLQVFYPPVEIEADLSIPLFGVAKELKQNPMKLAEEVANKSDCAGTLFSKITAEKGYVNFVFDREKINKQVFNDYLSFAEEYGVSEIGKDKTVVIDYSSPNIAKPFSIGHLRTTVLGQALCNIFRFAGYKVIAENHIGDWGTQFGKLIYAYKQWGNKEDIEASPIKALLELYVRFHKEAESTPEIENEARKWFKKLEEKDEEATKVWEWFKDVSLKEFERIYKILGVKFDDIIGESFYNDMLKGIVTEALDKKVAEWEEITPPEQLEENFPQKNKLVLIKLDNYGIRQPLLLQKSDGTSLYATRELAAIKHRMEKWNPERVIYVVGAEQKLHFQQCFKASELLGYNVKCVHIWFGLIRMADGKMSTREGRVIFLEDVLNEAIQRAKDIIAERDLTEQEKETVARIVGIGAIKYVDLSQDRVKDVVFDWNKMLSLDGDSAPYIQYVYTRVKSILRKADFDGATKLNLKPELLVEKEEVDIIKRISHFPEVINQALENYEPHRIANYLFDFAQSFNRLYANVSILKAETEELRNSRLALIDIVRYIIKRGLALLGIDSPEKM
ncbi:MAG: arginine--tRNA ligase [bacterium]|nr:arginine--tRNA ligase [bacterium]